jgi:hypothetical protein
VTRSWFALAGLPALARAVWRVRRSARLPIDRRAAHLRAVPRFRWPALADAARWSGVAGRLAGLLPVDGGPCLRRALVLLDLHARCGLEPRLELAVGRRDAGGERIPGHAWLSTDDGPRRAAEQGAGRWQPIARL